MSTSVDQTKPAENPLPHKALQLLDASPRLFAQQGSVVATWRDYRGRKLGPYYLLA